MGIKKCKIILQIIVRNISMVHRRKTGRENLKGKSLLCEGQRRLKIRGFKEGSLVTDGSAVE